MYTVYAIKSKEGFNYIGQTQNIDLRLKQHNQKMSKWTKRGRDWEIIFQKNYNTRGEAMKFEKYLKTGKGRDFLKNKGL